MEIAPSIHHDPAFATLRTWMAGYLPTSVAVVTDPMTEKWCLPLLAPHLPPGTQFLRLGQHGESIKSIEHAHAIWDSLEGMGMDRRGLVIALGGGTITDLAAFAASTYLRGVACWLVPTTLLAMVDAAVGGKNGINFRGLKNRIGTFRIPDGVSVHPAFLDTLDGRAMGCGWAEHIKHHLLHDRQVLPLDRHPLVGPLSGEGLQEDFLLEAIANSVRIKSDIVATDPEERNGSRAALNFGHTAGHALESWALKQGHDIQHGEAVAWGMRVALRLSEIHAGCPAVGEDHFAEASRFIGDLIPMPVRPPAAGQLWEGMKADKKNEGDRMRMVLLDGPGVPLIGVDVHFEEFASAMDKVESE